MTKERSISSKLSKWDKIFIAVTVVLVTIASFTLIPNGCSDWEIEKMGMELEILEGSRDYSEAVLLLIESIYALEDASGEFNNHDYWIEQEDRTKTKLDKLRVSIPAIEAKLSECNVEEDRL